MSVVEHQLGEGYSEHRKIPNVWDFREQQKKREEEANQLAKRISRESSDDYHKSAVNGDSGSTQKKGGTASLVQLNGVVEDDELDVSKMSRGDAPPSSGAEEKEQMMKKATAGKKTNKIEFKGSRIVTDPVTGQDVVIKDADFGAYDAKQPNLRHPEKESPVLPPSPRNRKASHTSPKSASPTNILVQPYPAPVDAKTFSSIYGTLYTIAACVCGGLTILWFLVAFRSGFWAFFIRSTIIGVIGIGTFFAVGISGRKLEKDIEKARAEMHRKRGITHSPLTPESAEWLNAMLAVVWPLIDPALFTSTVDMIEDIMQASLPKFVDAVRISDLGLGTEPFRIISMRGLPDKQEDKNYPREEWIYKAKPSDSQMSDGTETNITPSGKNTMQQANSSDTGDDINGYVRNGIDKDEQNDSQQSVNEADKSDDEWDQSGDYVNYEMSLSYRARPGQTTNQRANNIHLMIEFFLGAFDWFHIPIPIWIQIEGIVVTVRLRMQMVSQLPYLRNLTFTLMGVPKIEISAVPMSKVLPNVLDLPLISGFVQSSIAAAANEYVAPKSMTMNMAEIISGDGIKKDTRALGIFVINLHYAEDLSAQDSNGKSDPYIVLSFAKFGKPLYSTRIIMADLNPVFEETAVLLVSADEVKAKEELSIQLWDNDKLSADDLVGRIHVPLSELMKEPGKLQRRTDGLQGFEDSDTMQGSLTWSIAYYEKAKLEEDRQSKKGTAERLDKEVKDKPEMAQQPTSVDNQQETLALRVPPRKDLPSGILSIIVHQINQLERQNLKGATGSKKKRETVAGQDTDAPEEEGPNLPNSYCEIYVNDNMIYKTRTKMFTSMPFFEAGTEYFIRDWRTAIVRVAVRDARLREHDPLLGIVNVKLTDIFQGSSQVTQMMALQEGVGFGRANISFLFKAVDAQLPKPMLGWETGTVELLSDITLEGSQAEEDLHSKKLHLTTNESNYKVSSRFASVNGQKITWDIGEEDIRMPVYNRFANALHFEIGGTGINPLSHHQPDAVAVLWLCDLVDNEEKEIRLPVIKGSTMGLLRQNYLSEQMLKTHPHHVLGHLTCTVRMHPGLDPDHEEVAQTTNAYRHGFEVYDHVEGQARIAEMNSHANDDGVIDRKEQKSIARAHKKALESRHRGKMQISAVRTIFWMKDGLKARKNALKYKLPGNEAPKEPKVESEV